MTTEDEKLAKKYLDLATASERKGVFTFTGFLGLAEKDVLLKTLDQEAAGGVRIPYTLSGGYDEAERVICRFGDEAELGYEQEFPIVCLKLEPLNAKFAEKLSHRDCLGALMNLGITRDSVGDIIVGEKEAWLFCRDTLAEHIENELVRVRHTTITASRTDEVPKTGGSDATERSFTVASERLDAVIAGVYKKSRSETAELIRSGRVYVDGRLCENVSRELKAGETVNLRGSGKFEFLGASYETKKGRLAVSVKLYM